MSEAARRLANVGDIHVYQLPNMALLRGWVLDITPTPSQ